MSENSYETGRLNLPFGEVQTDDSIQVAPLTVDGR